MDAKTKGHIENKMHALCIFNFEIQNAGFITQRLLIIKAYFVVLLLSILQRFYNFQYRSFSSILLILINENAKVIEKRDRFFRFESRKRDPSVKLKRTVSSKSGVTMIITGYTGLPQKICKVTES